MATDAQNKQAVSIKNALDRFIHNIDALQFAFPLSISITQVFTGACDKPLKEFLAKHGEVIDTDGDTVKYKLSSEQTLEYNRLNVRLSKAQATSAIIPQSYILSLISQYDAFLASLLSCLYKIKPDMLKESGIAYAYAQLVDFSSIADAVSSILEKNIENTLRKSHIEQFDWMESKFGKLRENLPIWPAFVELTERRNLYAHCGGKVSAQYLTACSEHKYNHAIKPDLDDILVVTPRYFYNAHACLFEMGTKLAHTLWRKMLPDTKETADYWLNMLIMELIGAKKHDLAICIGEFACNMPKGHSGVNIRLQMVINYAQAYKWSGNGQKANEIIGKEDWGASNDQFKMAVALVKSDISEAIRLIKKMGVDGDMKATHYRDWPLCKELRESPEFLREYEILYGHQFQPISATPADMLFSADQARLQLVMAGHEAIHG